MYYPRNLLFNVLPCKVKIIKLDEYKPSEQKRAHEKVWTLNM